MSPQKKRPVKKKSAKPAKKRSLSQLQRMVLAVAFLAVFVVAALFMLIFLREKVRTVSTVSVYEEAAVADPVVDLPEAMKDHKAEVIDRIKERFLSHVPLSHWRYMQPGDGVENLQIDDGFPSVGMLTELKNDVALVDATVLLNVVPEQGLIQVFQDHRLLLQLYYPVSDEPPVDRPRIAIIMDDLGGSLRTLQQALDLGLSMTPSILPGEDQARASAVRLSAVGREYMIHIPMQPRSYPQTNPGADALLLSHSEEEARRRLRHYMEQVPGAVGSNNHMGSRYTEDAERMQVVLDELKQHNLFFIDSVTISSSVAFSIAGQMGLKTAARDIFLDHYEDVDYIRGQIRKLVQLAHDRRQVVAICHPYPETFEAFRLEMDWLKAQPVDFVPASHLVKLYMER